MNYYFCFKFFYVAGYGTALPISRCYHWKPGLIKSVIKMAATVFERGNYIGVTHRSPLSHLCPEMHITRHAELHIRRNKV